jgi:hypothetical protein
MEKRQKYLTVTKKLLLFVGISLIITTLIFSLVYFKTGRFFVSWLVFQCGIIGGFVSLQQRLKNIDREELTLLSESWASLLLIPVYGGVFSLLLYVIFLAKVIEGGLFPEFYIPEFSRVVTDTDIQKFLRESYPLTGPDFAKLIFWSFIAGFSERFVPQIIQSITVKTGSGNDD